MMFMFVFVFVFMRTSILERWILINYGAMKIKVKFIKSNNPWSINRKIISHDVFIFRWLRTPPNRAYLDTICWPSKPQRMNILRNAQTTSCKSRNCFGLLKGQWRRFKYLDVNSIDRTKSIIETCILVHNYGINYENNYARPAPIVLAEDVPARKDTTPGGHETRDRIARVQGERIILPVVDPNVDL